MQTKTYQLNPCLNLDGSNVRQITEIVLHQYQTGNLAIGLITQAGNEEIVTTNLPVFATFNNMVAINESSLSKNSVEKLVDQLHQLNIIVGDSYVSKSNMATYLTYQINDEVINEFNI